MRRNEMKNNARLHRGLTLVEMVMAMVMIGIIFAAILPQFTLIRNSWDVKQGTAEALQNGRVLIDHINRNLSKAVRITGVSASSDIDGYIEYEDNDGNIMKYDYDASGNHYVKFGPADNLEDLAGPVSSLTFTCYDACDLDTALSPVTDTNDIRVIEVDATFTNTGSLGRDKTFTTSVYLRVNSQAATALPQGLVGWWKLDETSGTTAADCSCGGNDGTLVNMNSPACWGTGHIEGALEFDGGDDYVNCGNDSSLNITGDITITLWLRADTFSGEPDVVTKGAYNVSYSVWLDSSGNIVFALNNNRLTSISELSTDTWYHIAVTRGGNERKIYIDGQEDNSNTYGSAIGTTSASFTVSSPGYPFNGVIDDVRIYNRALDEDEIAELANDLKYEGFIPAKVGTDGTSVEIETPAADEGDLLIAAVATDGDTTSFLEPDGEGWTEIDVDDCSNAVTLGAWWKLADASEPDSHTFSWSGAGDQQAYGWIMRFTGHDLDSPIYPINGVSSCDDSDAPQSPAVTTTVDGCLILRLGAFDNDDITVDDPGLPDHTPITMDKSAAVSGQVAYEVFAENNRSSDGESLSISKPSGTSQGDLLIAALATDGGTSPSPPSGWNVINVDDYSNQITLGVWYKIAGSSEPSNYTFNWSGDEKAYGWIMRFTGHNQANPINNSANTGGQASSGGWGTYRATSPAVTTTVANCLILRIGGFDDDDITTNDTGLDDGHTDITMDESGGWGGGWGGDGSCSGGAGYKLQATTGSSGTVTFDLYDSEQYRAVTVAIAPYVGGGTVSGGAGYVGQETAGSCGTSNFSLNSSNESQMLTIAVVPADEGSYECCGEEIRP